MKRTLTFYQEEMKKFCKEIEMDEEKLSIHYPHHYDSIKECVSNKINTLNEKLKIRHQKKFQRDGLQIERASEISMNILKSVRKSGQPGAPQETNF